MQTQSIPLPVRPIRTLCLLLLLTASQWSCDELAKTITPAPYGVGNGQITFWSTMANTGGSIIIQVDGSGIGSLTKYYPSGSADCQNVTSNGGNVTFIGRSGTHSYRADTSDGKYYWEGTFTLDAGSCKTLKLY